MCFHINNDFGITDLEELDSLSQVSASTQVEYLKRLADILQVSSVILVNKLALLLHTKNTYHLKN